MRPHLRPRRSEIGLERRAPKKVPAERIETCNVIYKVSDILKRVRGDKEDEKQLRDGSFDARATEKKEAYIRRNTYDEGFVVRLEDVRISGGIVRRRVVGTKRLQPIVHSDSSANRSRIIPVDERDEPVNERSSRCSGIKRASV
jgi:hypothetical protein